MPKNHPELTAERLREILTYDPNTGEFRWRISINSQAPEGAITGYVSRAGYSLIRISGRKYRAHRLAWLYVHGRWPKDQIDHINRIRNDNRITNLREATHWENQQNRGIASRNSSRYAGVCWHTGKSKWHARIKINGRYKHIGYFEFIEDGVAARAAAKAKVHTFQPS